MSEEIEDNGYAYGECPICGFLCDNEEEWDSHQCDDEEVSDGS